MSELLCEGTGQMQVSGWFTCTITGHRMGAGGNEISSCVAGASKVCSLPLRFSRTGGIEFRHEGEREGGEVLRCERDGWRGRGEKGLWLALDGLP